MINFLNDIRNAENPISNNRKLINTIAILFLGIALGTFSKYLDFRQTELPGVLMAINGVLDIGNFLGRFAIWILIALCISIYSNSAIRASINVFVFFVGMVASYYLYSNYIAGFFPRSYAMIWFGFTAVSPLLAFVCWYAKGKSKLAFILSALILAVLFNMCFVYGCWYFNAKSVLEVIVFIIGLIVLRRDTLRSSALMGTISIVLAVLLDMVIPFHFGYAKKYHPEQYNGTKFSNPYLWGTSSVRTILGRQEYLGHTVLRKSVSTNFKLHKRKETDEDEQYVFQNTHEPIISQELWDSVQKRRCRVNRASAWGTHTNRLSGYLYCADCGRRLTLQTHYSKKDGSTQYSYRCGGYASRVNGCTAHSISADNVEALILAFRKKSYPANLSYPSERLPLSVELPQKHCPPWYQRGERKS